MKVLVTGATGHVGNVVVKQLYKLGYDVYSLVMPFDRIDYIKDYSKIVYGNILDLEGLKYISKEMDYIIHAAGYIDIGSGNKKKLHQVNVVGTQNVMIAAHFNDVKRVIYTSSVHAIEELSNNQIMSEVDHFDPKKVKGNYAKSKAIATQNALDYAKEHHLDLVVVHLSGVIGSHDYKGSYMGELVKSYLKGKLPVYIKGGYNYIDVFDAANGIIGALEKGRSGECYILSGHTITIKYYLDLVSELTHLKPIKKSINYNFMLLFSKLAELYYKIARRKMLYSTYSIKVLKSNANFSNQKAVEELGLTLTPFKKTVERVVNFIIKNEPKIYKKKLKNTLPNKS